MRRRSHTVRGRNRQRRRRTHDGRTGGIMTRTSRSLHTLAALMLTCIAMPAAAQNHDDNMTCYKMSDPTAVKATLDLDSDPFGLASGCQLSKAAMLCVPSDAQNMTPAPPLSLRGP